MTTRPAEQPRPSNPFSPWLIRLPILVVSGAVLLMLILTALVGVYEIAFRDRILPGISSYGIDLGSMTRDQARAALDGRFTYAKDAVFTFRDGDKFWQLTAGDLGVSFDADATVADAYAAGHGGSLFDNIIDQALIWLNGRSIDPIIRYDQSQAVDKLVSIANEIDHPPQDATLAVSGTDIQATPGRSGRVLDVTTSLRRLDDAILSMSSGGEVPLAINETPPVAWDAEAAAQRAQVALSAPVLLIADDANGGTLGPWSASVDQIRALLRIETVANGDGTYTYQVNVDPAPFEVLSGNACPRLDRAAAGCALPLQ